MLDFYYLQNGNDIYGKRLFEDIVEKINLLKKQPFIGKETNYFNVRVLIINRNSVFYLPFKSGILVLLIWDNRRDPKELFESLKGNINKL